MVAVRTRSRRARQKVSDGNPRSGADRGGRANKARAPASSSPGDSRSSECSRVDTGRRRRLAASSAGDFDLAGVGAPRRMASSVRADHSAADRLLAFSRSCGGGARGNLRFLHTCAHTNLCRGGGGVRLGKCRGDTASEKCHARFRHDGFDAKFNVEATVLQVSRDSRTRAAVEPSCTTTRATRTDRGPQARIKNYFIQPRPTSEIQHDAAATNASKPKK